MAKNKPTDEQGNPKPRKEREVGPKDPHAVITDNIAKATALVKRYAPGKLKYDAAMATLEKWQKLSAAMETTD